MKTPEEIATHCTHNFGLVFGDVTSGRLARQWAIASARRAQSELAQKVKQFREIEAAFQKKHRVPCTTEFSKLREQSAELDALLAELTKEGQ